MGEAADYYQIADMEDGHLVNAIRMLATKRKQRKAGATNFAKYRAKYLVENAMRAEAAKRDLDLCEDVPEIEVPTFVRKGVKIVKVKSKPVSLPAGRGKPRRAPG